MRENVEKSASALSRRLRIFYGVGEFGQQLSALTLNMYLLYFYTNVMGISGEAAGLLLLVARVWDATNDPLMGMIIDNTHSKHGKCRPYLLYCAVPAGLFLFLTFVAPGMSSTAKLVWVYVTYIGQGILYIATGISYTSLISRITDDPIERVGLNQSRVFISIFAAIFVSSMTLPIIQMIGWRSSERTGFAITIGVYGVLQVLCYICVSWLTRGYDRQEPRVQRAEGQSAGTEMFKSLGYIVKNSLWRWLALRTMLYYISAAITQGILVYYVKYYLERPDSVGVASLYSMVSSFFVIILLKVFAKKLGRVKNCAMGVTMTVVCLLIHLTTRDSIIPLYLACLVTSGFGLGPFSSLLAPSLMGSIDYGEWQYGKRNDALVISTNSFGNKSGGRIGGALPGFLLDATGYEATAVTQTVVVRGGLFNLVIFVLLTVFFIVLCIMLVFNRYEERMPAIRVKLAECHKAV